MKKKLDCEGVVLYLLTTTMIIILLIIIFTILRLL